MRTKYPRTYHLHHSPNLQNDDRRILSYDGFYKNPSITTECPTCQGGRYFTIDGCHTCHSRRYLYSIPSGPVEVTATLKMDGENTTMYNDHIHARSLDSAHHQSRTIVKALHGQIKHDIPNNVRICGENLQACHSIYYTGLPAYFLVFNVWEDDYCLDVDDTNMYCEALGLKQVPQFYRGTFDLDKIQALYDQSYNTHEGYVIRTTHGFPLVDFQSKAAKFVRKNHVQTDEHWMNSVMIQNKLKEDPNELLKCYSRNNEI